MTIVYKQAPPEYGALEPKERLAVILYVLCKHQGKDVRADYADVWRKMKEGEQEQWRARAAEVLRASGIDRQISAGEQMLQMLLAFDGSFNNVKRQLRDIFER
jgi:hypothetical protein